MKVVIDDVQPSLLFDKEDLKTGLAEGLKELLRESHWGDPLWEKLQSVFEKKIEKLFRREDEEFTWITEMFSESLLRCTDFFKEEIDEELNMKFLELEERLKKLEKKMK